MRMALLLIFFAPSLVYANVGVPMLALAWPAEWLALIPIVALESEIMRRSLNVQFKAMIWPVTKANLISTLVGVPVAWIAMLTPMMLVGFLSQFVPAETEIPNAVQYLLFPLTAAWVMGSSSWQIYAAFLVLAVPFCLMSIFLEKGTIGCFFPNKPKKCIRAAVVRANIWSYVLLCIAAIAFPLSV